jgi:predicted O-methyltransferase YrrM
MTVPPTLQEEYLARLRDPGSDLHPNDIRDEMPYLLQAAAGYQQVRVLEFGVRSGRSTSAFLAAASQVRGHVWSVDIDAPQVPSWWHTCGYWTFKQANDLDVTPELEGWPDSYHVVFIDTSHALAHTLGELRRFVPYTAAGGVVLCHDTRLADPAAPGARPYVAAALDLFCAEWHLTARTLPWSRGKIVKARPLGWSERGGSRYGLGVIETPNG